MIYIKFNKTFGINISEKSKSLFLFRFDTHEFRRSDSMMSNLAFAAFGKDYKMKIFKPEPILHPDVRIETIDKDHTRRWDKAVPDCFSVGTLGENWTSNEGHVSLTHCDGLVHTWVILYHSMI